MTNEEIVQLIQQGGNDELLPLLWKKINRLLYKLSGEAYRSYRDAFLSRDIEIEDIEQECYCVMLNAIKGYKKDQEYSFISYLKYPFKNMIKELLGIRTSRSDTLDKCSSLDELVYSDNDTSTVGDTVKDNAIDIEESITQSVSDNQIASLLWREVDNLEERQKDVLIDRYKNNKTLVQIGKEKSLAPGHIRQIEAKALRILRSDVHIRNIYDEYGYQSYRAYHSGFCSFKKRGHSQVEDIAIKRTVSEHYALRKAYGQAEYLLQKE